MQLILSVIILILVPFKSIALTDNDIRSQMAQFNMKALPVSIMDKNEELYRLGKVLFFSESISGNRNISCGSCHSTTNGSADSMPLGIGEGFQQKNQFRFQDKAVVLARNTPALYNLSYSVKGDTEFDMRPFFWDGRVSFNPRKHTFFSPSSELVEENKNAGQILSTLSNGLALQSIFPLINHAEMRGQVGTNEIADAKTDLEAWQAIVKRAIADLSIKTQLKKAYPKMSFSEINIAHLANAIAEFERIEFFVSNTPYDNYVRGNNSALNEKEKRGLVLFIEKGRCVLCHNGPLLSNQTFRSVGAPQIGPGILNRDDLGREHIINNVQLRYTFRVPPLRNISKTAPYMHDGAFKSLRRVVVHYNNVEKSLMNFAINNNTVDQKSYKDPIFLNNNEYIIEEKIKAISPMVSRDLGLLENEIDDLVYFLENSLTSP